MNVVLIIVGKFGKETTTRQKNLAVSAVPGAKIIASKILRVIGIVHLPFLSVFEYGLLCIQACYAAVSH